MQNSFIHENAEGNRLLRVTQLVSERLNELKAFNADVTYLYSPAIQGIQNLPISLRRRAASHNTRRLPFRLRRPQNQNRKASPVSSSKPAKPVSEEKQRARKRIGQESRPCRKFKRRHCNVALEFQRRSIGISSSMIASSSACKLASKQVQKIQQKRWLPTHVWHAKRFHMTQQWGFALPISPNLKSFRPTQRAFHDGCLMQDSSFNCVFQLTLSYSSCSSKAIRHFMRKISGKSLLGDPTKCSANYKHLKALLKSAANQNTKNKEKRRRTSQLQLSADFTLYTPDAFPFGVVGPIQLIAQSMGQFVEQTTMNDVIEETKTTSEAATIALVIIAHPAIRQSVMQSFISALDLQPIKTQNTTTNMQVNNDDGGDDAINDKGGDAINLSQISAEKCWSNVIGRHKKAAENEQDEAMDDVISESPSIKVSLRERSGLLARIDLFGAASHLQVKRLLADDDATMTTRTTGGAVWQQISRLNSAANVPKLNANAASLSFYVETRGIFANRPGKKTMDLMTPQIMKSVAQSNWDDINTINDVAQRVQNVFDNDDDDDGDDDLVDENDCKLTDLFANFELDSAEKMFPCPNRTPQQQDEAQSARCALWLISRTHARDSSLAGWTLFVPPNWIKAVWTSLIYLGCRPIGVPALANHVCCGDVSERALFSSLTASLMHAFPLAGSWIDSAAAIQHSQSEAVTLIKKWKRQPKRFRIKCHSSSPSSSTPPPLFDLPWNNFVQSFYRTHKLAIVNENAARFFVCRDVRLLHRIVYPLLHPIRDAPKITIKDLIGYDANLAHAFIMVRIHSHKKGRVEPRSLIGLPRTNHEWLRPQQNKFTYVFESDDESECLAAAVEEAAPKGVSNTTANRTGNGDANRAAYPSIGFVQNGEQCLRLGHFMGLGLIHLATVIGLFQREEAARLHSDCRLKVLLKAPASDYYRSALLELIC